MPTSNSRDDFKKQLVDKIGEALFGSKEELRSSGALIPAKSGAIMPTEIIPPQRFDEAVIREQLEKIRDSKTNLIKYFAKVRTLYTLRAHQEILSELEKTYGIETRLIEAERDRMKVVREHRIEQHKLKKIDKDLEIHDKERDVEIAKLEAEAEEQITNRIKHQIEAEKAKVELEQLKGIKPKDQEDRWKIIVEEMVKRTDLSTTLLDQVQSKYDEWEKKYGSETSQEMVDDLRMRVVDAVQEILEKELE